MVTAVGISIAACSGGTDDARTVTTTSVGVDDESVGSDVSADEANSITTTEPDAATTPATMTTLPRATMTVVQIDPVTGEATEVEQTEPGPATLAEVVDFGIEAGLWDQLGGLERVLGHLAGVVDAGQVPGVEDVQTGEFSEVLDRANSLALSGDYSDDELARLRRLYEVFVPTTETLEAIATAERSRPQGFAATRATAATPDCAPLDVDDADADAWVVGCYRMIQSDLGDALVRVFYPDWYDADGNLASVPPIILETLIHSTETFRSLGTVGNIDVIIAAVETETFSSGATAGVTAQWQMETVVGCPITLNPGAMDLGPDVTEQVIAHEAWHCVQHYDGYPTTVLADSHWYREGGAHYFSNVAYPRADYEHRWLRFFDEGLEKPIFDMSYEAWIFWQYLGNQNGVGAVADLHREMMNAGTSAIQLLRPYQEQFHDFIVDYVAGVVLDQSGAALPQPTHYHVLPTVTKQSAGTKLELELEPLTATRWIVQYDKQLRVIQTDASSNAFNSMVKWSEHTNRPAWQGIHPEVRSSCGSATKYAGVTTNVQSLNTLTVTIDVVEEASCDPCLLGTWSLDLNTFEQMIVSGMQAQGGGLPPGTSFELSGAYYVAFGEDSAVLEQRDGLTILASSQGFSIPIRINSFAEGEYSADGQRVTVSGIIESYNEVTIDAPVSFTTSQPSVLENGFGSYTCSADALVVTVDGFDSVAFARVDKILVPPDSPANGG